jgi:acyl carrier protein
MDKLIAGLAEILEEESSALSPQTRFREHKRWDSLAGLSLLTLIEDEYGVVMGGTDLKAVNTVDALMSEIEARVTVKS